PRELALDGLSERLFVGRREPVHDERVDRELDPGARHVQPPVSASVSGFSSFAYSLRAAWSTCDARTVPSPSAARNAALSAMLRMLPPVTLRRARRSTSSVSVGVCRGKIRRQIAARCAASGN